MREAIGADVQLRMVERDAVLRPLRAHDQLLGELADDGRRACPQGEELAVARAVPRRAAAGDLHRAAPTCRRCSKPERRPTAPAIRQASKLLDEAGWTVGAGGLRRNAGGRDADDRVPRRQPVVRADHQPLRREPAPDRHRRQLPRRSTRRRCRSARRTSTTTSSPAGSSMSLSPSIELRSSSAPTAPTAPGTLNLIRRRRPGGRRADRAGHRRRQTARRWTARVRALDRVLRAKQILGAALVQGRRTWIAYWDVFGRPDPPPPYSRGDGFWWFDAGQVRRAEGRGRASSKALGPMGAYILRRLLLMIPTLFGILLVNFVLVQFVPGGPIEQIIAQLEDDDVGDRPHHRRRRRGERRRAARASIAARRACRPSSSPSSSSSSASTSRRSSGSC